MHHTLLARFLAAPRLKTAIDHFLTSIQTQIIRNRKITMDHTIALESQKVDIDLTKSQLHDVLFSNFTDSKGNNISENIEKMSKLFETHNQIMEKILSQLIIMNSNYKQVTVPEAMQTNTKQAKSLNDFRKTTENP